METYVFSVGFPMYLSPCFPMYFSVGFPATSVVNEQEMQYDRKNSAVY